MNANTNSLNWFEIPVIDIKRAKQFYETIFEIQMDIQEMTSIRMAFFPAETGNGKVSGALCESNFHQPSMGGNVIYLNGDPDLQNVLEKVEAAGGKVMLPKTQITPEIGHMAFFVDTEGNRMGLHSQN